MSRPAGRRPTGINPNRRTCQQRQTHAATLVDPKPAVSGSESKHPNRQNPADSREFLGLSLDLWGESPQRQTQWRWGESRANSSLGADP